MKLSGFAKWVFGMPIPSASEVGLIHSNAPLSTIVSACETMEQNLCVQQLLTIYFQGRLAT